MQRVHVQIVPEHAVGPTNYQVRVLLPITQAMTLSDVKARWLSISSQLEREIRKARREPAEAMVPEPVDDALAVQFTVRDILVENPDIDLYRFLLPQIRQSVAHMMSRNPQVWRPT